MLLGQQALVKEKSQEIWYEVLTEYFNLSSQIIDTLGWGHVKRPCGIHRNQVTTHHLTPLTLIINLKGKNYKL